MLDNEPNDTQNITTAAPGGPADAEQAPARPARKRAASKRTAKKAAAPGEQLPITDAGAETAPGEVAAPEAATDTAPATAGRAAKKTAARRTAKKAVAEQAPSDAASDTPAPVAEAIAETAAPAKKTTRRRTTKKAAAASDGAQPGETAQTEIPVGDAAPAESADAGAQRAAKRTSARGAATAAVLFQAPVAAEPVRRRNAKKAEEPAAEDAAAEAVVEAEPAAEAADAVPAGAVPVGEGPTRTRRTRQRRTPAAKAEEAAEVEETSAVAGEDETEDVEAVGEDETTEEGAEGEGPRRRRRRRGGRRRRKPGDAATDENADGETEGEPEAEDTGETAEDADQAEGDEEGEGSASSRRRRRRRRRKGEDGAASTDDPEEVVVRVREPRGKKTGAADLTAITAVEGSTRLAAKKQRRQEGRAAGRRRAPIVTEAEFLARRESVQRTMVIRARGDLTQIAVSEDNVLVEHYVAQEEQVSLIGNVYLGRVQNVLPSMEAAFIDIGKGRNAVLYAGEVDWATLGGANGPRKIESVLKSGQSVLVQVTKDPIGHKGARLTNQISLPGRYVVYVPRGGNGGISRKLPDTERNRLKGILKDIVPDEAGVIVRTAAEGASEEELTRDVSRLKSYWDDIEKKSGNGQAPQLLYGEPDLLIRVVRDLFTEDFNKLVISGDEAFDLVNDYVSYVAPHLADRVEKWTGDGDVFANFRIDEQIKKALDRKVWLPSGGSLIIERTEAMTVVDVNTGKFTGSGGNLEETVTRNNLEAAEEIVRQLRLRDIGGIIVIDFIDMVLESNRDLVLRRLVECLGRDRTKHQVAEVTSLGLVQMTRKRIGTGLLEAFSETCDHCGGRGLILHDEPREPKRRQGGAEESGGRGRRDGGREAAKSTGKTSRGGRGRGRGKQAEEEAETPVERPEVHIPEALVPESLRPAQPSDDAGQATTEAAVEPVAEPGPDGAAAEEPAAPSRSRRSRSRRAKAAAADAQADSQTDAQTDAQVDSAETPEPAAEAVSEAAPKGATEAAVEEAAGVTPDQPDLVVTPV